MVALRIQDQQTQAAPIRDHRSQSQAPQPGQRRASLIERMSGQYWRLARRERVLLNIGAVIRDDLVIMPLQCSEAIKHLKALRQATQAAHSFYSQLDPQAMKAIAPWGILTKLAYLDDQTTELLLLLSALAPISTQPSYARVQLQLAARHLYPFMFTTYDEATSQLAALVTKAQARGQAGEEAQG